MFKSYPTQYWQKLDDGRVQCDVCPRECRLHDGQRGLCFVRGAEDGEVVLYYVRSLQRLLRRPDRKEAAQPFLAGYAGTVVRHGRLQPGLQILPELGHQQVAARSTRSADPATPDRSPAAAAERLGCRSVAFTYNDPMMFMEYAIDVAQCMPRTGHQDRRGDRGLNVPGAARANSMHTWTPPTSTSKAFTERFYQKLCGAHLGAVLETLAYLKHETRGLVRDHDAVDPRRKRLGRRDRRDDEVDRREARAGRAAALLGVPSGLPMLDKPPTPPATLTRAREHRRRQRHPLRLYGQRARRRGGEHVLPRLRHAVIERDWYGHRRMAAGCARRVPRLRNTRSRRVPRTGG